MIFFRALFSVVVIGMLLSSLESEDSRAWNIPKGARGHVFLYVNGAYIPVVLPLLTGLQDNRANELLTQTLPSDHIHVYSTDDYSNGSFQKGLQQVADEGGDEPVDIFTLTHSGGADLLMPGDVDMPLSEFFTVVPQALLPRLRLFMNAGCYGAQAYSAALPEGFPVAVGALNESLGPLVLDDFLTQWLQGATANEAASRVNWSCTHSALWTTVFDISKAVLESGSQSDYCQESGVIAVEGFPGAGNITISSPAPGVK